MTGADEECLKAGLQTCLRCVRFRTPQRPPLPPSSCSPLPELASDTSDEVSAAIGRHVAALIPNGACLQLGIGRIPNAVAAALREHADLGVVSCCC